ncbi:MAG: hypothetical protein AAF847_09470 [Bacteroidota bacterium]
MFAEDEEKRTIVEIQKVDYDYNYDRFSHYFMANMLAVQRNGRDYAYQKDIYVIVVMTETYKIKEKNGKAIKDDVLVTDINPRNLKGELRYMQDHKMVILNPRYADEETPKAIKDWLDLIMESIVNAENPQLNLQREGIAKAAKIAEVDSLTPEQIADAKVMEMRKIMVELRENQVREEVAEAAEKRIGEVQEKAEKRIEEVQEEAEKRIEELQEEAEKRVEELQEEAEKRIEEMQGEAERRIAEMEKRIEEEHEAKQDLIKNLAKANMSTAQIAVLVGMSEAAVIAILEQEG